MSGELPCSREEAAILAGIQLHLEEAWPEEDEGNQPNDGEGEERENEHLLTRPDGKAGEKKRKEIFIHNRYTQTSVIWTMWETYYLFA